MVVVQVASRRGLAVEVVWNRHGRIPSRAVQAVFHEPFREYTSASYYTSSVAHNLNTKMMTRLLIASLDLRRTPSLKVAAEFEEEDETAVLPGRDNVDEQQVARGLVFDDGDGSGGSDDSDMSSVDSSSDEDDANTERDAGGLGVEPFDVDNHNARLGRSRSVHPNLQAETGSPIRKSSGEADHAVRFGESGNGNGRALWRRQRPSPMSTFAEGEKWLASATKLGSVGLRKRDIVHDDLFFVCFSEVCQTAIHTQLQHQRKRLASDTSNTFRCGDQVGSAPQQTRTRSTPHMTIGTSSSSLDAISLRLEEDGLEGEVHRGRGVGDTSTRRAPPATVVGGADEIESERERRQKPSATAWVPPHRRVRKVGFADGVPPPGA